MKKALLLLLTVLASITVSGQTDKRLAGIEKELENIMKIAKAPGFAVAVVNGHKVIYAKGFGYRDFENKIPVDANTLFAIGSTTKAFTSAILGQLQEEGKLSLDDSPIKHIPDLKFFNNEMNNSITIKDLMSHRTGLPRHDLSWYLFPSASKDSLMKRLAYQEPFTGVRNKWRYNNFMFLAQGVLAERITGKSWEHNISERFFKPLGMSRSNTDIAAMKSSSNAAFGYNLVNDQISKMDYYDISGMSPAGAINSSVNDMSKWLMTWINNGKFNEAQIVPKNFLQEAISSQMVANAALPGKENPDLHLANYGYAWAISSYKGHYHVAHGGNIDGFSALASFFPSDSIGIVVLTNQNGSQVPSMVRNIVADRMLKVNKGDWAKFLQVNQAKAKKAEQDAKASFVSTKIKNTTPSHALSAYTGNYSSPGYGEFAISQVKDSLFANYKLKKFYLQHIHHDSFEFREVTKSGIDTADAFQFIFSTSYAGQIDAAKVDTKEGIAPIEFKRKPAVLALDKVALEKYAGEFTMGGTVFTISVKNGTLFMLFPGQPEYEFFATGKHQFSVRKMDGFGLEFKESDDKSIKEVFLIQPNGRFAAKRK